MINHYNDPHEPISIVECQEVFFFVAHFASAAPLVCSFPEKGCRTCHGRDAWETCFGESLGMQWPSWWNHDVFCFMFFFCFVRVLASFPKRSWIEATYTSCFFALRYMNEQSWVQFRHNLLPPQDMACHVCHDGNWTWKVAFAKGEATRMGLDAAKEQLPARWQALCLKFVVW